MNVHHYTNDGRTWVVVPPPERCVWAMPSVYTVEEARQVLVALSRELDLIKAEAAARFALVASGYQQEIKE